MSRKTSKELKAELLELELKQIALRNRIIKRANGYIKKYPDVPMGGSYTLKDYGTFEGYGITDALYIIEAVEKHNASLHPHQQTTIDYSQEEEKKPKIEIINVPWTPSIPDVCNCDKRDMAVYKDQGKYWCPQCGYEVI